MNLGLIEYDLALNYSLQRIMRTDVIFALSLLNEKKGKGSNKGNAINLIMDRTEIHDIEEWVHQQYKIRGN